MQVAQFFPRMAAAVAAWTLWRSRIESLGTTARSESHREILGTSHSFWHVFLGVLLCFATALPVLSQEAQSKDAPKAAGISASDHDFFFTLRNCLRAGPTVSCTGSVTNKDQKQPRVFGIMKEYTNFVDDSGEKHPLKKYAVGTISREQELQPDLAMDFSVESEGLNPTVKRVTVVLGYVVRARTGAAGMPYRVVFKDVPISSN